MLLSKGAGATEQAEKKTCHMRRTHRELEGDFLLSLLLLQTA